jgi:hypothetical protein
MPNNVRNILATLAGFAVAFAVVMAVEMIGHSVYPPPGGLDIDNAEQMRTYIGTLTLGALAFVLLAWWLGTFLGGLTAGTLSRGSARLCAGIVGALIMAATIANLLMFPHPLWVMVAGPIGIVIAGWLAGKLAVAWKR